ncbi:hypothetical protein ARALYDRAFT_890934 [Arabidopsis lyrata subsp. lyrata]|uniref:Serine carboxypeptidase family protein n=1 Tax=Arabidopsis lyrata subsp. lyrata TaxID=81972 RepID=D7KJ81_ARALL|nr:hypothetical protein ARALYDRAFT_890934 [Arabidopsis lyrata subsp. lyrata]
MSKAWKLKLLLLLQLLLLSQHDVDSASVISYLPGFEGLLPFHLETGYIGVGEGEKVQLFYYFIKSENNPEEDPLILWLTGGPACTALSALALEIGPLTFKTEGYNGGSPSLVSTSYSWTKVASIIFLDQPVGTGFSYSTTPLSDKPSDTGETKQTYEFLQKWLVENPDRNKQTLQHVSNPFYVGGDSYAGIVVRAIVQQISIGNEHGDNPKMNLKGYILGNPSTDLDSDHNSKIPYAHRMGLISDELYESLKRTCQGNYVKVDPTNIQCLILVDNYQKCVSRINEGLILIALCDLASPNPYSGEHGERSYLTTLVQPNLSLPTPDCYMYRYLLASHWANDEDVRRALHVVKGSIGKWMRLYRTTETIASKVIIGHWLIYSGDHDMMVPYTGTEAWIKSLNYSITDDWRPWFVNNQGGGHTAEYKPEESFIMFQRWISGRTL